MQPVTKIELGVTFATIAMLLYINPVRPWRAFVVFSVVLVGGAVADIWRDFRKGGEP